MNDWPSSPTSTRVTNGDRTVTNSGAITTTGVNSHGVVANSQNGAVTVINMADGIISTAGLSMFPFILPSSINPQSSLTVWNASSSHLTLFIMLICTAVFLPLILIYTAWVYRVLWGRTSTAALKTNPDLY